MPKAKLELLSLHLVCVNWMERERERYGNYPPIEWTHRFGKKERGATSTLTVDTRGHKWISKKLRTKFEPLLLCFVIQLRGLDVVPDKVHANFALRSGSCSV